MDHVIFFLVGFLGALLGGFLLLVGVAVAGAYRYRKESEAAAGAPSKTRGGKAC